MLALGLAQEGGAVELLLLEAAVTDRPLLSIERRHPDGFEPQID